MGSEVGAAVGVWWARPVHLVACGSACVVVCGCLVSVFSVRKIFEKMC